MCVCVCVYMYVYIHTHRSMLIHICLSICIHTEACLYIYAYVYVYTHLHLHTHKYICTYLQIYTSTRWEVLIYTYPNTCKIFPRSDKLPLRFIIFSSSFTYKIKIFILITNTYLYDTFTCTHVHICTWTMSQQNFARQSALQQGISHKVYGIEKFFDSL